VRPTIASSHGRKRKKGKVGARLSFSLPTKKGQKKKKGGSRVAPPMVKGEKKSEEKPIRLCSPLREGVWGRKGGMFTKIPFSPPRLWLEKKGGGRATQRRSSRIPTRPGRREKKKGEGNPSPLSRNTRRSVRWLSDTTTFPSLTKSRKRKRGRGKSPAPSLIRSAQLGRVDEAAPNNSPGLLER